MSLLTRFIFLDDFEHTIAPDDLVLKQRFRLFKTATLISFVLYVGFIIQFFVVVPGKVWVTFVMIGLFIAGFINYFALNVHKHWKIAFALLIGTWFILLHIDTYFSGGIRNSANFYLAVLTLTAFMLLGNKGGKIMAAFSVLHLVYFFVITKHTTWISLDLVGRTTELVDFYFFITTTFSILALTFQSVYIENSKIYIVDNIKAGKAELQRSETMLAENNMELERKNKELEDFAFVASHDLQEPLKTSAGFAKMLKRKLEGNLDEKTTQYIDQIVDANARMQTLIQDLLEYSRLGHQRKMERIHCNELLQEILKDVEQLIKDTNSKLTVGKLPEINGYRTEIKLLFQNLMINAIKFRRADVQPLINISAAREDRFWHFTIEDNGIGIDEKYFGKIFTIFQRLHTQSAYKGSGIGLAHCKKIVELHNGSIWVDSVVGNGSKFHFTIPA